MVVTAKKLGSSIYYTAYISRRGVTVSLGGDTRIKAIMRTWEEYTYQLYK